MNKYYLSHRGVFSCVDVVASLFLYDQKDCNDNDDEDDQQDPPIFLKPRGLIVFVREVVKVN